MATNIDRALYQAPEGLNEENDTPELEIDIVNPEMVTLDDGSVEITIIPDEDGEDEASTADGGNA